MSRKNIWYFTKSLISHDEERNGGLDGNLDDVESDKILSTSDSENDSNVSGSEDGSEVEDTRETRYKRHLSEMKRLKASIGKILMPTGSFKQKNNKKEASTLKVLTERNKAEELYFKDLQNEKRKEKKSSKVSATHRPKFYSLDRKSINRKTEVDPGDVESSPEDFNEIKGFSLNLAPIYMEQPKVYTPMKLERYTVDQEFYDCWNNNSKMDEDKLKKILKLWTSDNWEGLYDPPEWLTPEMFNMALTDEQSNERKVEKLIEATENLEIAKRTNCKTLASFLEKGAINVGSSSSNEPFMKCFKSIGLEMHGIYENTKVLYKEQNAESLNLKNDLTSVVADADHVYEDEIASYEKLLKAFDEEVKLHVGEHS